MATDNSNAFISQSKLIASLSSENLIVLESGFNLTSYQEILFSRLKIDFPIQLRSSVKKRQAEFLAGRIVAKRALKLLGSSHAAVPIGKKRAPIWPDGIIGSISHSNKTALTAVAYKTSFSSVGLDHESLINENLDEIASQILSPGELSVLESSTLRFNEALTLTFSAKESLFKALFPEVNEYFDFTAAKITLIDSHQCTFEIELVDSLTKNLIAGNLYTGKYLYKDSHITTLIVN